MTRGIHEKMHSHRHSFRPIWAVCALYTCLCHPALAQLDPEPGLKALKPGEGLEVEPTGGE